MIKILNSAEGKLQCDPNQTEKPLITAALACNHNAQW